MLISCSSYVENRDRITKHYVDFNVICLNETTGTGFKVSELLKNDRSRSILYQHSPSSYEQ